MKEEIRSGITKFSVIYPYWTDITYSEDPKVWEMDLREHQEEKNSGDDWKTFFDLNPNKEYGGFGFEVNSLEELEELSRFFREHGFTKQLRSIPSNPSKKRYWFTPEDPNHLPPFDSYGGSLFIFPFKWERYPEFRKLLLKLWEIGFLVYHKNFKYY